MKFKFLTLAVLAMLFTACKPEPDDVDETNPNNGDGEKSYISLTLTSGDGGSKGIADYNDGTDAEVAVSKAYVFFFKNGEGFAPATGTANNWKELTFADPEDDNWTEEGTDPNVSDISEKVMAIYNYNGELPNQMVVVLNWTPTSPTYSLAQLRATLVSHVQEFNSTDYFVMSNSVYQGSSGPVYATPLAITDFKTNATDAVSSPIKVYVERVAAKVVLTTDKLNNYSTLPEHMFPLLTTQAGSTQIEIGGKPIYAKILDWELYNDYEQSTIIKNIDGLDDPEDPYLWNDISHFRSTWAVTSGTWAQYNGSSDEFFTWGTPSSYTTDGHYCGENTRGNGNDDVSVAQRTKIIIKAQLTDEDGDAAYDVARWFGHLYMEEADLLSAVSNTVASKYYYIDGGVYKSISAADLMTVAGNGNSGEPKKYQVYFQLNTADGLGINKTWYTSNADGTGYTQVDDNATINTYLKENIAPALVYKGGRTYFFTDVKHLNNTYGVVRNHYYDVNIKSISGLGTPIPDASAELDPELPADDQSTYLATEINILSWNVVSSDIDL